MEASPDCGRLLVDVEGLRLANYVDSAGYATIGVGHLLTPHELSSGMLQIMGKPVPWTGGISEADAWLLLRQDLAWAERSVGAQVTVPLTATQFDALCSFVYNIGAAAFIKSTLLRQLNAGIYRAVPDQMRKWVYAGGKLIEGLAHRREKEIALWERA